MAACELGFNIKQTYKKERGNERVHIVKRY